MIKAFQGFFFIIIVCLSSALLASPVLDLAKHKVVYIFDIDDTLKYARLRHRGHLLQLVKNAFSQRPFAGMPELCRNLNRHDAQFYYVSAIPKNISFLAVQFLKQNRFPEGPLHFRPSLRTPRRDFKIEEIMRIVDDNPDATIVLVGDNGEKDPIVFDIVRKAILSKRPEQAARTHFFVNMLFDSPSLPSGQTPYIGALALALNLRRLNLLTDEEVIEVGEIFREYMDSTNPENREQALPFWSKPPLWLRALLDPFIETVPSEARGSVGEVFDRIFRLNASKKPTCADSLE